MLTEPAPALAGSNSAIEVDREALDLLIGRPTCARMLAPSPRPPSLAWLTGRTIGYWWAYRPPSPTPRDPDHYVRRLVAGLFIGVGVYVLFWPTVVLILILAVAFGY